LLDRDNSWSVTVHDLNFDVGDSTGGLIQVDAFAPLPVLARADKSARTMAFIVDQLTPRLLSELSTGRILTLFANHRRYNIDLVGLSSIPRALRECNTTGQTQINTHLIGRATPIAPERPSTRTTK
jgi:hypothetical protein